MPISGITRNPPTMEDIVRPFIPVLSFSTPRVPPEPIPEQPEAFIEWGGPSVFSYEDSFRALATSGIGFHVDDPGDQGIPTVTYTETGRLTTDKRIENPEDADQFVIVQRIDRIAFQGPGGGQVEFILNNSD